MRILILLCLLLVGCAGHEVQPEEVKLSNVVPTVEPVKSVDWVPIQAPTRPRIDLKKDLSDKKSVATLSEESVRQIVALQQTVEARTEDVNRLVSSMNDVIAERNQLQEQAWMLERQLNECRIEKAQLEADYKNDMFWSDAKRKVVEVIAVLGLLALAL